MRITLWRAAASAAAPLVMLILLLPGAARADSMLTAADRAFLAKAAQGGELEVKAGRLAVERASAPAVRTFGTRMVADHSAINEQLKSLADSKQFPLPTELSAEQQKMLGRLEGLNGAEFDNAYAAMMVRDHTEDVGEFEHHARASKDPQVKAFATQTLPTLREHLSMARELTRQHRPQ